MCELTINGTQHSKQHNYPGSQWRRNQLLAASLLVAARLPKELSLKHLHHS
jgi:hypothetical protein